MLQKNHSYPIGVFAPVAIFCYTRKDHLIQAINALSNNNGAEQTELFVFSDGAKLDADIEKVVEVRAYLQTIKGFKSVTVVSAQTNKGLKASIIDGVAVVLRKYDRVIVLEDDIVTDRSFLQFMNKSLEHYSSDHQVCSVSGFSYINYNPNSVYFLTQPMCWGWATWARAWNEFQPDFKDAYDLNFKNWRTFNYRNSFDYYGQYIKNEKGFLKSWYIFWYLHNFTEGKLTVYPGRSLTKNIGFDGTGTNSGLLDYNVEQSPISVVNEFRRSNFDQYAYDLVARKLQNVQLNAKKTSLAQMKRVLMLWFTFLLHKLKKRL